MKKLLVLIIVVVAIGVWVWNSNQQAEKARIETEKQLAAEKAIKEKNDAEKLAAEKIRREAEAVAKVAAEAKLKAEAEEKRLAEEKARLDAADPVKQLAKLEDELKKTDPLWLPYKTKLQELRNINPNAPENQNIELNIQQQAKTTQQQIRELVAKIAECNNSINQTKTSKKRIETGLNAGGSKKDKYSGWYYVDTPGIIHPISDLDNRNHSRRIAYVSKKETIKDTAIANTDKELDKLQNILSGLQQQRGKQEQQYQSLQQQLSACITQKRQSIINEAKSVLAQRKDLRTKIAVLKKSSSDTELVASRENED